MFQIIKSGIVPAKKVIMRVKLFVLALLIASSSAAEEKAVVFRISDGDNIVVILKGVKVNVRLIGIDAPESRKNEKAQRYSSESGKDMAVILSQGKRAAAFMKSILRKGDGVTLEYDADKYDRYGRTLAYVYLPDGRMLNDLIILSGYASPLTVPPNVKYKDRFLKSYKSAWGNKTGLWSEK